MQALLFLTIAMGTQLASAQNSSADKPSFFMQMVPILAFVGIFFFLVIRPNAKKQKLQQAFLGQLKRGDEVLTSSGIFGTIEGLTEKFVTLEVAQGVRIRVLRSSVAMSSKEVKND